MDAPDLFLRHLALVLIVAAATAVLFQRLHLPVIVGYILAGIVIGPGVLGLVRDARVMETLAELGVILLMASLGLEFSFRTIGRLGLRVAVVAFLEVGGMLLLGTSLGQAMGWSSGESVFLGAIVAISSTMIIAKVFDEMPPPRALKELVLGVLIMEDLVAIVLIVLLTAVAGGEDVTAVAVFRTLGRLLLVLLSLLVAGMLVVPRGMRLTARLRRPETTLVAAVGVIFLFALVTRSAGYSVALGAFVAGALLHESGAGPQLEALLRPVRDMFAAIFFVAVGLLIDPRVVLSSWPMVAALVAVVWFGKTAGVSAGALLAGYSLRTAVQAGVTLAQIGEFSYLIAGLTLGAGVLREGLYPVAVAVSVLTAFATPWLVRAGEPLALALERRLPKPVQTVVGLYGSWLERLRMGERTGGPSVWRRGRRFGLFLLVDTAAIAGLIVGTAILYREGTDRLVAATGFPPGLARLALLGAGGVLAMPFGIGLVHAARRLARLLSEAVLPAVPPGRVDQALAPRRTLAVTIEIGLVVVVGLPVILVTQPFVPFGGMAVVAALLLLLGIAFWRTAADLQGHARAGADLIVHVLARQGAGTAGEGAARGGQDLAQVEAMLPGLGSLDPVRISTGSVAVGKTLGELKVRGRTGATVVAHCRGDRQEAFPAAGLRLEAGDLIALSGSSEAVAAAHHLLAPDQYPAPATPTPARDTNSPPSDMDATARPGAG